MNDEEKFETWLGQNLSGLRNDPCPDASVLSSLLGKDLSAEQHKIVMRHIAACGYCDLIVTRMGSFESALRRDRRARWIPVFAGAVLLCVALSYPAYQIFKPNPAVELVRSPNPAIVESPQVLHLDTTRGVARIPSSGDSSSELALSFFIPVENGHHYDALILNRAAVAVLHRDEISFDALGNCLLTFKRRSLQAGGYTLVVTDRESPMRKLQFPFEI